MRRRQLILGLVPVLTGLALAHPGHGPHTHEIEIDAEEAALLARDEVARKVREKKLESSWLKIEANPAQPIQSGASLEWKVTFDNPAAPEGQRRLYVFLRLNGQVSGINFTGR